MNIPYQDRLGIPGVAGLGLLLFCLSFYFGSIAPERAALADMKQKETQLLVAAGGPARGAGEVGVAGRPVPGEVLRSMAEIPGLLKELNTLAVQRGVAIDRAAYTLTGEAGQRRMEINLPLKANYPSLRAYLREVMMLKSPPSLDELTFKRQQSSDPLVEAAVRLSYRFAPAS